MSSDKKMDSSSKTVWTSALEGDLAAVTQYVIDNNKVVHQKDEVSHLNNGRYSFLKMFI